MKREIPLKTLHPDDLLWVCAELTLLFHTELDWGDEAKTKWNDRLEIIFAKHGRGVIDYTATTRNLCEAIRVAMDQIAMVYADQGF